MGLLHPISPRLGGCFSPAYMRTLRKYYWQIFNKLNMTQNKREYLAPETEVIAFSIEQNVMSAGNESLYNSGYSYGNGDFD